MNGWMDSCKSRVLTGRCVGGDRFISCLGVGDYASISHDDDDDHKVGVMRVSCRNAVDKMAYKRGTSQEYFLEYELITPEIR